jgi:hypothetical protein
MTPTHGTTRKTIALAVSTSPRTPRCEHTSLTKPECHCPACLTAQIAAHAALSASA